MLGKSRHTVEVWSWYSLFALLHKRNNSKTIHWITSRNCDDFVIGDKIKTLFPSLSCAFPSFSYLSKYFAQIYRSLYGAAMSVVHQHPCR